MMGMSSAGELQVGAKAPDFTLPDLDGNAVQLSSFQGKVVVLEWFNPGCPFVKYAHAKGPLEAKASSHEAKGVVWLAINSSAPGKQGHGVATNKEAVESWKMSHPVLLDEDGKVGQTYGARTTPQMYIVAPDGTLAYQGALDNAPLGKKTGAVVDYVDTALASLAAGQAPKTDKTKPYGCSVKY
jgi:peroxiredoxin